MKVLILGLSKSGTTALVYKIYNSLGKADILFEPSKFVDNGAPNVVAKVLIDGHLWHKYPIPGHVTPPMNIDMDSFAKFDKKILIVRDPKDRAISDALYRFYNEPYCHDNEFTKSALRFIEQKEQNPDAWPFVDFYNFVNRYRRSAHKELDTIPHGIMNVEEFAHQDYLEHRLVWYLNDHPDDAFILHYEDFVDYKLDELESYLELPLTGSANVPKDTSRVERTKYYGDYKNWFTPEDIPYFQELCESFIERFPRYADWTLNNSKVIRPKHGSKYVRRIANEARSLLKLPAIE